MAIAQQQLDDWMSRGFFIAPRLIGMESVGRIEEEVIGRIRADPPAQHPGRASYLSGKDYLVTLETAPSPSATNPEDRVSKVFNCHAEGETRQVAGSDAIVDRVAELLGPDLDCFQSQFIFKNPGVVGQPWHQDSLYFDFTLQPQIGVWLALSRATLENGCLWVLPGSQREPIHRHVPDRRPQANHGYLEIVDHEFEERIPVTMEPGDVLFFHSFLMHMSTDNVTDYRRSAMVYHYGRAGTQVSPRVPPDRVAALNNVNRWIPVRRASGDVSGLPQGRR
jgi:phytanoyl-CoA hydroxylase